MAKMTQKEINDRARKAAEENEQESKQEDKYTASLNEKDRNKFLEDTLAANTRKGDIGYDENKSRQAKKDLGKERYLARGYEEYR